MPLYEYECSKCGGFEQIRLFSDPPLESCPKCNGPVEKLLSAPAFQFKGTGWYITDYARKSAGANGDAKAAPPTASTTDSSASPSDTKTTSESKPAGSGDSSQKAPAGN